MVTNPVHNFYLLPGGGIESNENTEEAAKRECEEEINYGVDNIEIIAKTKEFRGRDKKEYTTYCVSAKITDQTSTDTRTDNEKELGMNAVWMELGEALKIFKDQEKKLKDGKVKFYNIGFNIVRDKLFFEKFKLICSVKNK